MEITENANLNRMVDEMYHTPRSVDTFTTIRLLFAKVRVHRKRGTVFPLESDLKIQEVTGWLRGMQDGPPIYAFNPIAPDSKEKFAAFSRGYETATPPRKELPEAPPIWADAKERDAFSTLNTMKHNERIDELLCTPRIPANLSRLWYLLELINGDRFVRRRLQKDLLRVGDVWKIAEVSCWVRTQLSIFSLPYQEKRLLKQAATSLFDLRAFRRNSLGHAEAEKKEEQFREF